MKTIESLKKIKCIICALLIFAFILLGYYLVIFGLNSPLYASNVDAAISWIFGAVITLSVLPVICLATYIWFTISFDF